jgi:hypothetical protein
VVRATLCDLGDTRLKALTLLTRDLCAHLIAHSDKPIQPHNAPIRSAREEATVEGGRRDGEREGLRSWVRL